MQNPVRSEQDAFRLVLLTVGYLALIAIGWRIDRWLGLVVFVVLTAAAIAWVLHRGRKELPVREAPAASPPDEHRILVVANETVGGSELLDVLRARAAGSAPSCSSSAQRSTRRFATGSPTRTARARPPATGWR